jgi:hypothetical protein
MGLIILNTAWWTDVNTPTESIDWRSPRHFDASRYTEYQEFIDDMNQMSSPIQIRTAPYTD